jgi:hypothetical protein
MDGAQCLNIVDLRQAEADPDHRLLNAHQRGIAGSTAGPALRTLTSARPC